MSETDAKSRPSARRHWRLVRNVLLGAVALLLVTIGALVWYVHTDSFRSMVRGRLIAALENITGGHVDLAKVSVVPFRFRVEARDLTIHGTEAPGQAPYAHVDDLIAEIKIMSILQRQYGFHSLRIDHPVLHIIVYPDGSTNQPRPQVATPNAPIAMQHVFAMAVNRLQVTRGELLWNDEKVPLELAADDVSAGLEYSFLHNNYEVAIRVRKLETQLRDVPAFTSTLTANLALGRNYANFHSFEWSSGQSHLEGSGILEGFERPKLTGTYNARLGLADVASILKIPEIRGGVLEIGGKAVWASHDFFLSGKAAVQNLDWRDNQVTLRNAAGSANFAVSSSALKLSEIQARALGGAAAGSLEVVNWKNQSTRTKLHSADEQRGALTLKLKDISVAALAGAIRNPKFPWQRLRLAGLLAGNVDSKWIGSPQSAETSFNVAVSPPAQIKGSDIPIMASANGRYRGSSDELDLTTLNLASRSTQLQASGTLSRSAMLRFSVSTSDLRELQPIFASVRGANLPVALNGTASFGGNASGTLDNFHVAGQLQMANFDTLLPASANAPQRSLHWDSLTAEVRGSPSAVSARNGLLTHGSTRIHFDASSSLQDGQLTDNSAITARVEMRRADLRDVQALAGYAYPVTGVVDLTFTASGTKSDPHGDGHVELTKGTLYGQPLGRLSSDLHFAGHEVQLNNTSGTYREGEFGGSAAYNPVTRGFRFDLNGKRFDLADFSYLQAGRIKIGGGLEFTAQGAGTLDAPIVNAKIRLHDLSLDGEPAGDFTFDATTHGADMQLTGRSNFEEAKLSIDGNIHMRGDWLSQLTLRFDNFDIDSLLRPYLGSHLTTHMPSAGTVQLAGPVLRPGLLNANGVLTSLSASIENFAIHNEGPIHFKVENRVLALDRLRLIGDGTDLTAQGTMELVGDRTLNIRSDGRLNLKLLDSLAPGLSGSGLLSIAVKLNGTYANPSLAGTLQVANGSVSSINLPNGLSEMNGTLVFNQDRLQIQTLDARVGGGNVSFSGFMTYSPHVNFNINAKGTGVRLRPAGISASSDAELRLTGSPQDALLSGEVTVLKLTLTPGFDFARYLEGMRQTSSLPEGSSFLNNLRLDIHIVTTPELQMEAAAAKVSGDADLRLRGTYLRPVLLGRVDILEGDVYFSGTKYRLERGEITFTGPTGIRPTLDLEATTRVRDYDISLGVNGTPDKLNLTYRSEPPLPSADIVALLALGRTESEAPLADTSSSQAVSQQASSAILSQALNATLSSRSQRLFGISRIKVDPNGLNTETTPTRSAPAVTLEQQVSSNLTVTYSTEVSQTSQQVIQAEYNVTRNISILAVRDQNGVVSFDVLLRHRRK